jgi:hypothetical protein
LPQFFHGLLFFGSKFVECRILPQRDELLIGGVGRLPHLFNVVVDFPPTCSERYRDRCSPLFARQEGDLRRRRDGAGCTGLRVRVKRR